MESEVKSSTVRISIDHLFDFDIKQILNYLDSLDDVVTEINYLNRILLWCRSELHITVAETDSELHDPLLDKIRENIELREKTRHNSLEPKLGIHFELSLEPREEYLLILREIKGLHLLKTQIELLRARLSLIRDKIEAININPRLDIGRSKRFKYLSIEKLLVQKIDQLETFQLKGKTAAHKIDVKDRYFYNGIGEAGKKSNTTYCVDELNRQFYVSGKIIKDSKQKSMNASQTYVLLVMVENYYDNENKKINKDIICNRAQTHCDKVTPKAIREFFKKSFIAIKEYLIHDKKGNWNLKDI